MVEGLLVIKGLFSPEELKELSKGAAIDREKYPFPGHKHPHHGTLRPQRLTGENIPTWVEERCLPKLKELAGEVTHDEGPYFIHYPVDTLMHEHTDSVPEGQSYWKIGILVEQDCVGGSVIMGGEEVEVNVGDAYIFRASHIKHEITKVTEGQRLVITMGYVT